MLQASQVLFAVMTALNMSNFNRASFFNPNYRLFKKRVNRRQFKFTEKINYVIFLSAQRVMSDKTQILRGNSLRRIVKESVVK